jgi:hypothetical protein
MAPRLVKLLAIGALLGAGVLLVSQWDLIPARAVGSNPGADLLPRSPRLVARPPTASPVDRLLSLRKIPFYQAPDFEVVERWTRSLDESELRKLIEDTRQDGYRGLCGWLRCALFAEWGRRDAAAALAYRETFDGNMLDDAAAQATFSIFRGWAKEDPEAALAGLKASSGPFVNHRQLELEVGDRVLTAIFNELATRDPELALRLATAQETSYLRNAPAMKGLFRGLGPSDGLVPLIRLWTEEVWNDPSTVKTVLAYEERIRSGSHDSTHIPPEPEVAIQAALALADGNPEAAETWLRETSMGSESFASSQILRFYQLWSCARPDDALARLKRETDSERRELMAGGVLFAKPHLGPELMAALPSGEFRYRVIREVTGSLGIYSTDDFFPASGRENRLCDFQANRDAILVTLAAANLPPGRHAELLKKIHDDFIHEAPSKSPAR